MKTTKGSIVITKGRLIDGTGAATVPDAVIEHASQFHSRLRAFLAALKAREECP